MFGFDAVKKKIFGDDTERALKRMQPIVDHVNGLETAFSALTDDQLKAYTPDLKQRLENGEPIDELLPDAFALVRETSKRVLEMRHFDVQLIGGLVLHRGMCAEM